MVCYEEMILIPSKVAIAIHHYKLNFTTNLFDGL